jgi:hypothetical protein
MTYAVEITDAALNEIDAHARYIAIDRQSPLNAKSWLERVWDAIDDLEGMPQRHALAAEDAFKLYRCGASSWEATTSFSQSMKPR